MNLLIVFFITQNSDYKETGSILKVNKKVKEMIEKLLKKKDVCAILDISPATLDRKVKNGELERVKIGNLVKFRPEAVQKYIDSNIEI